VKRILIFVLVLISLNACHLALREAKTDKPPVPAMTTEATSDIWISQDFQARLDSVDQWYRLADARLNDGDTVAAEALFNMSFLLIGSFSEHDVVTLMTLNKYDSLLKSVSTRYEEIYEPESESLEAEEILEDIIEIEEIAFPDSVLFSGENYVDNSTGFPITINQKVRLAMQYFQTKGRPVFTRWMERSGKYEKLVKDILVEEGVPTELFYVAMIESGFNPQANSYARAVGMWQFISATGKAYGLRHDWWFDERRDVIKASHAAARHFKDLYASFDDWYLSLAGYNCNPKRVKREMRQKDTNDFWQLNRLPRQTRNYVPTFLAARILASSPEKFGFEFVRQKPLEYDVVELNEAIDLNLVARFTDTTYQFIREINPAVLRWTTPPGVKDFALYLPKGKKDIFLEKLSQVPAEEKSSYVRHKVRSGETISTIARKYHTTIQILQSQNSLKGTILQEGHYLIIPVPQNSEHYYQAPVVAEPTPKKSSHPKRVTEVAGHKKVQYVVKAGDTIGEIAENFKVRAGDIRSWNGLRYGQYIYPKQVLAIWIPGQEEVVPVTKERAEPSVRAGANYYVVKTGDTLWDIAKKYNISVDQLKALNKMRTARIKAGDKLVVPDK